MAFKTFAELKKNRNKASTFLLGEMQKLSQKKTFENDDKNIWYPEVDKAGNTEAIIRFLPAPLGEDLPINMIQKHSFQGPSGRWYIENSLRTIGQDDPVQLYVNQLWQTKNDDNITLARLMKAKTFYTTNVLVIKDKMRPENNGKVVKFRFGKKIFEKINEVMYPAFDGDEPMIPFDPWNGANFRLRIKMGDNGFRNYDSSKFDSPSPLADSDEEIEKIISQSFSLLEDVAPDKFKSFDELKSKLMRVLDLEEQTQASPTATKTIHKSAKSVLEETEIDDDDELESLKSLLDDDDE